VQTARTIPDLFKFRSDQQLKNKIISLTSEINVFLRPGIQKIALRKYRQNTGVHQPVRALSCLRNLDE
jgi:hypothetical protein